MSREQAKKSPEAKISREFAARLERLKPDDQVRAIVMLNTGTTQVGSKIRPTKKARRATVKKSRQTVAGALPDIDRILKRHHGKRLKSQLDALSAVPVVTTPAGIDALTVSEYVRAILEDQALFHTV
jgi:flagellar motor switch protein FliM